MAREQRIVLFDGRVQGVGFRYIACRTAAGYDVTGTVRNLPDGRVECVVEGERDQIDAFLSDLGRRMTGYIRDRGESSAPPTGEFRDFGVRY
jgi:acylphosphatase